MEKDAEKLRLSPKTLGVMRQDEFERTIDSLDGTFFNAVCRTGSRADYIAFQHDQPKATFRAWAPC